MKVNLLKLLKEGPLQWKKTKMVCTIGPASDDVEILKRLLANGMNICRINFSHDDHTVHYNKLLRIREAVKSSPLFENTAIMLDTKGPEIRTGLLEGQKVNLKKGDMIELTGDYSLKTNSKCIPLTYHNLAKDLKVGNKVLIADGNLTLKVTEINNSKSTVMAEVMNDFVLGERKNVNLPGVKVDLPVIAEKDRNDLIEFGLKHDVDMVALSFTRSKKCVEMCKDVLGEKGKHIKIIPKIENQEGMENLEEILKVSDGIMIARGDLGMEMEPSKLFLAQNYMTEIARKHGKPIIMATQMLESMTTNSRPTRAEITDVGAAVWNLNDSTMLSGETGNGKFPVESVRIMSDICAETESHFDYHQNFLQSPTMSSPDKLESLARGAVELAFSLRSKLIIVESVSDKIIEKMAALRPGCIVMFVNNQPRMLRGVQSLFGVYGVFHEDSHKLNHQKLKEVVRNRLELMKAPEMIENAVVVTTRPKSISVINK